MTLGGVDRLRLADEIQALDDFLLSPIKVAAPDPLTDGELVALRAYVILSHAAVEEFVEVAFTVYVRECLTQDAQGMVSPAVYLTLLQLAEDIGGQLSRKVDRTPAAVIGRIPGLYEAKFIVPNHGVREGNVQAMALGAGLPWQVVEDACPSLIPALSTLGARRGEVAHVSTFGPRSGSTGVRQVSYPSDARRLTAEVLSALPELLTLLASGLASPSAIGPQETLGLRRRILRYIRPRTT